MTKSDKKCSLRPIALLTCATAAIISATLLTGCNDTSPSNDPSKAVDAVTISNVPADEGFPAESATASGSEGSVADASEHQGPAAGAATPSQPGAQVISPEQALEMMGEDGVVILDVRERDEFVSGHIEGAVLLPYESVNEQTAAEAIPAKDAVVLVYCRSGRRSAIAAQALVELGYSRVYDFGGIVDWPYDVVKG